jgi:hypothetical protein
MTVIEVRGLVKRFGPATVVDGLSFAVEARAEALRAALAAEGAAVLAVAPDRLKVTGLGAEQIATLAAALGIPVFEMTADAGSLEEAFLRLTATEGRPG